SASTPTPSRPASRVSPSARPKLSPYASSSTRDSVSGRDGDPRYATFCRAGFAGRGRTVAQPTDATHSRPTRDEVSGRLLSIALPRRDHEAGGGERRAGVVLDDRRDELGGDGRVGAGLRQAGDLDEAALALAVLAGDGRRQG